MLLQLQFFSRHDLISSYNDTAISSSGLIKTSCSATSVDFLFRIPCWLSESPLDSSTSISVGQSLLSFSYSFAATSIIHVVCMIRKVLDNPFPFWVGYVFAFSFLTFSLKHKSSFCIPSDFKSTDCEKY